MTLEPIENDRTHLLAYLTDYKVVVCRKCAFAIQPGAFSSHLLRHQVYRSERRELLKSLSKLKLNNPDDIQSPSPDSKPISCFPVYSGYICNAPQCGHAFVSQKRMSLHWSEVHGEPDSQAINARPAKLQTFFRGNKLKYFEVSPTSEEYTSPNQNFEHTESPTSFPGLTRGSTSQDGRVLSKLDMESLKYLYHYIASTGMTLSRGNESTIFWTRLIVEEAFKYEFLMYAILSTAAFHLATTCSAPDADKHIQAGLTYQEAGLPGFRSFATHPDGANGTALIAFTRLTSIQRCAHGIVEPHIHTIAKDPLSVESPTATLVEFFTLVRGRIELCLELQNDLPAQSDFVFRGEALQVMQRLTQEQLTSDGPLPFLTYAVATQLDISNSPISDREMVEVCSRSLAVDCKEEITGAWISTLLPHLSDPCFTRQLVEVLRHSLMPARLAYEQSLRDNTSPPFPPLSRFQHLPSKDYARISDLVAKIGRDLPSEESCDLPEIMPEIIALLHCFGRANAYDNCSAPLSGLEMWAITISPEFITMIEERRAVALLITADFCRLLQTQSEAFWFLKGQGDRLVANIRTNLSSKALEILDTI